MIRKFPFLSFSSVLLLFLQINLVFAQKKALEELLNMSLEELSNIQVITASKIPQNIETVPATVRVITTEQIANNGYLTLEEALADLPGMQFRNINGFNSYVFMRGVPSQNNLILVLVDGIQINELNSGGFYGGGQYNLQNVDRIEIVYGPASALYGTNAVSGIVNIITKSPQTHTGLDLYALYGTFNTVNAGFNYGQWSNERDLGWRISGMFKTTQKANLKGAAGDNNWSDNMENFEDDYSIDARLTWRRFDWGLNYQNKQTSTATYNKAIGTHYLDTDTYWNIRFINSWLRHNIEINKKISIVTQAYYRNSTVMDNSVLIVTDTSQVGYYRPNQLAGIENLVNYNPTPKSQFIAGIVYEYEELAHGYSNTSSPAPNIRPLRPPKPDMDENTLFSIYGQYRYKIYNSLKLYAGARFDNSSIYDQVVTPRLGLVFNKNHYTGKLLYTEAFRAPKAWDYTDGVGNPNLKPEEISSLEFYSAYNFKPTMRVDISVFRNFISNKLVKENTQNSWRWINYGELHTNGLELTLEYEKQPLQTWCNYSLNRSLDENDAFIPEISKHQFNAGLHYRITQKLRFTVNGHYYGERKNPRVIQSTGSDMIKAALVMNASLAWLLNDQLEIRLFGKNILDAEYYHTSNLPPDRYRQPQRSLTVQANVHY
ncbi:MAG TPA: TonB-dependent receptor [bacterium]|nr:TonB-dependent receptor [bacterium]HPN41969.1 TonB-dependent receptor [bacterium]